MSRRCLVVEDERPLGEMICDNLEREGYQTELLGDGHLALQRLQRRDVDLVVLDVMLPGKDGFEVLEALRRRDDHTAVLIVSARGSDRDRIRGLELGADDYLGKPFVLRELLLRVNALLRRSPPPEPEADTLTFDGNEVQFRSHLARTHDGRRVELSTSEVRLLRLLASRQGQVVSRAEIVKHLFGPATMPTARTIDNLVLNLRRLFEHDRRKPRHLHTVRGAGLKFTP